MKRILLIAYAYPPYPIVGAIRAGRLADTFADAGHQVHVLTARLPQDKSPIRSAAGSLTVETVPTWPHPKDGYRWAKRRLKKGRSNQDGRAPRFVEHEPWQASARVPRWKRYILSILHVPDEVQGFIPPAVWRGLRAFPGGPDLIYTTAPPNSAHLAALVLRVLTRAPWVAEFRDPWIGNTASMVHNPIRSRPAAALDRWLERRCLAAADRVVSVTESAARSIAERMPEAAPPPVVARNGIDRVLDPPGPPGDGPFRILYVGEIGSGRDPVPFLEAVSSLAQSLENPAERLRVDFVGNCRYYGELDLQERAAELGIDDLAFFTGRVPHEQALQLQRRADLLLLLAQRQPAQVPNKLYEYLGASRPILALVDEEGESARMLRQVGGHYLVTERDGWAVEPTLREAFEAFAAGDRFKGPGPDRGVLESWKVDRQMRRLMAETEIAVNAG